MKKDMLIDKVSVKVDITKADAEIAIDAVAEAVQKALKSRSHARLVGFGAINVKKRTARLVKGMKTESQKDYVKVEVDYDNLAASVIDKLIDTTPAMALRTAMRNAINRSTGGPTGGGGPGVQPRFRKR